MLLVSKQLIFALVRLFSSRSVQRWQPLRLVLARRKIAIRAASINFGLVGLTILLSGCSAMSDLSELPQKTMDNARPAALSSPLYLALQSKITAHPGKAGVVPLGDGVDAFVARLQLIQAASSSIDLQYYIYHKDETGRLLTGYLLDAANRGVTVRLLLDDLTSPNLENDLLALSSHPNIHIRLFNPSIERDFRSFAMLLGFARLNHRMHNKSITVDGVVTVVGGRNIGDEYFAASNDVEFGDFDLLAVGDVVTEVSAQFDAYWNASLTQPIEVLNSHTQRTDGLSQIEQWFAAHKHEMQNSDYVQRLRDSQLLAHIKAQDLAWYWGEAKVLVDPPHKLEQDNGNQWLLSQLKPHIASINADLILVSPYFVPTESGSEFLIDLAKSGKHIRIITNSLAATDVLAVHAGYKRYRHALLAAGIELYEVKAQPSVRHHSWRGSSKSSLHAKTVVFDNSAIFVGSFNFDPRSASVNTEMGLYMVQPAFAAAIASSIDSKLTSLTYRLALEDEQLIWWDDGEQRKYYADPDAGFWRILMADILGLLPIESQL